MIDRHSPLRDSAVDMTARFFEAACSEFTAGQDNRACRGRHCSCYRQWTIYLWTVVTAAVSAGAQPYCVFHYDDGERDGMVAPRLSEHYLAKGLKTISGIESLVGSAIAY